VVKKLEDKDRTKITVKTIVNKPVEKVWECFTLSEHITRWSYASEDWFSPVAENDLRVGGKFLTRMEAKDGSYGFDFCGIYEKIQENELIYYTLGDGREVKINFISGGSETKIIETFDAEEENSIELQEQGWQQILNNFKKYTEGQ